MVWLRKISKTFFAFSLCFGRTLAHLQGVAQPMPAALLRADREELSLDCKNFKIQWSTPVNNQAGRTLCRLNQDSCFSLVPTIGSEPPFESAAYPS